MKEITYTDTEYIADNLGLSSVSEETLFEPTDLRVLWSFWFEADSVDLVSFEKTINNPEFIEDTATFSEEMYELFSFIRGNIHEFF